MYYIHGFHEKLLGENFLMHIHVLMLCRSFEHIPIKINLFQNLAEEKTMGYSTGYYVKNG